MQLHGLDQGTYHIHISKKDIADGMLLNTASVCIRGPALPSVGVTRVLFDLTLEPIRFDDAGSGLGLSPGPLQMLAG